MKRMKRMITHDSRFLDVFYSVRIFEEAKFMRKTISYKNNNLRCNEKNISKLNKLNNFSYFFQSFVFFVVLSDERLFLDS